MRRNTWLAVGMATLAPLLAAQVAPGKFLIAHRSLLDPNFTRTVVLLVRYGEDGAMGLILNRPTKVPLSRALDGLKDAKSRSDPVYLGGPVEVGGVVALLRSRDKLTDARHVFADIYLLSTKTSLERALAAGADSGGLRAYLGYAGWGAGQLDHEIELGSWLVWRGDPATVFDPDPETMWSRLIQKTEARIALLRKSPILEAPIGLSH